MCLPAAAEQKEPGCKMKEADSSPRDRVFTQSSSVEVCLLERDAGGLCLPSESSEAGPSRSLHQELPGPRWKSLGPRDIDTRSQEAGVSQAGCVWVPSLARWQSNQLLFAFQDLARSEPTMEADYQLSTHDGHAGSLLLPLILPATTG